MILNKRIIIPAIVTFLEISIVVLLNHYITSKIELLHKDVSNLMLEVDKSQEKLGHLAQFMEIADKFNLMLKTHAEIVKNHGWVGCPSFLLRRMRFVDSEHLWLTRWKPEDTQVVIDGRAKDRISLQTFISKVLNARGKDLSQLIGKDWPPKENSGSKTGQPKVNGAGLILKGITEDKNEIHFRLTVSRDLVTQ